MSNNLWNRVADFFKEWDGEDMTKSMSLYVDELRQINSNRIELIRLERERKEIQAKVIDEFAEFFSVTPNDLIYKDYREVEIDKQIEYLQSKIVELESKKQERR